MIKTLKNIFIGSYLFVLFIISLLMSKYEKLKRNKKRKKSKSVPKKKRTYPS